VSEGGRENRDGDVNPRKGEQQGLLGLWIGVRIRVRLRVSESSLGVRVRPVESRMRT